MPAQLVDATPTSMTRTGDGWYLQFGQAEVGKRIGAVYLTERTAPHYTRFRIVLDKTTNIPAYAEEVTRPLTPEELAHFTALVKAETDEPGRRSLPPFETPGGRLRI